MSRGRKTRWGTFLAPLLFALPLQASAECAWVLWTEGGR
jgi:hypothetical protein